MNQSRFYNNAGFSASGKVGGPFPGGSAGANRAMLFAALLATFFVSEACARVATDGEAVQKGFASEAVSNSDAPGPAIVDLRRVAFAGGEVALVPARWEFYWRRYLKPADFRGIRGNSSTPVPDATVVGMKPWGEIGPVESIGASPPGVGYATYRMRLLVPSASDGREFGFRLQQQLSAYRVFANGELMYTAGRVGRDRASSEPERAQHSFFVRPDAGGEIELIVHVANFHMFRGGLRGAMAVGERIPLEIIRIARSLSI